MHVVPGADTAQKVLLHPMVSEKSTLNELRGQYTFKVARTATKVEIKRAIKELYGVVPQKVRTMHYDGKKVRFGRTLGRRKDWKKAVVIMPKGQTLPIHEGV